MASPLAYTGNSAYCYSHSLHMCLLASGYDPAALPSPGFIECLTTLPFGKSFMTFGPEPELFLSNPHVNPDEGLTLALDALGWTCTRRAGDDETTALAKLREALAEGPVLIGPLDMGHLTYNPGSKHFAGADHFVMALEINDQMLTLHDPHNYPFATLPLADLMNAWKAERVGYVEQPYVMRSGFHAIEQVGRADMLKRTVSQVRRQVAQKAEGPPIFGGVKALELACQELGKSKVPGSIAGPMLGFTLPLMARRGLDAALFLSEAGLTTAAKCMERQARLCGGAMHGLAKTRSYEGLRETFLAMVELERQFEQEMSA